ncbi:MAG: YbhB/YbcL family Raf kinase inhibitor-like protein [Acidimicrobiales bacterium]
MSAVRRLPALLALVLVAAACSKGTTDFGVLAAGEKVPRGITVTSTAFDPGDAVPERYSCEGENVPPPLSWKGVPAGTAELAVVVEDPDAPTGIFVHWIVVGIDPGANGLSGTELPPGAEALPGSSDNPTYIGPCPPNDDGDHRYVFEVYALRRLPAFDAGATPVDKVRAIRRAAVAGGFLLGTFAR